MLGANDSILTGLGTEPFRRHACDHGRDEAAKEAKERCTHTADLINTQCEPQAQSDNRRLYYNCT